MKITSNTPIKSYDTSSGRGNDIVEGLENVSSSLQNLESLTEEIANPSSEDSSSPYVTDRPDYDASRIKGTEKEVEWKKVSISREQQLKEITNENNNQISDKHSLSKNLNII